MFGLAQPGEGSEHFVAFPEFEDKTRHGGKGSYIMYAEGFWLFPQGELLLVKRLFWIFRGGSDFTQSVELYRPMHCR